MGYIYEGMDRAKEGIKSIYAGDESKYGPIWQIIDKRWHHQLHRPIHAAAYYLNLAFHFSPTFRADAEVLDGLYLVMEKMAPVGCTQTDLMRELQLFSNAQGETFSHPIAKESRTTMMPDNWWSFFGPTTPNLQKLAIRILSQPCSASGCERNWSMFEHIHSKRRNRLSVEKMNDLIFVHYNLHLRMRKNALKEDDDDYYYYYDDLIVDMVLEMTKKPGGVKTVGNSYHNYVSYEHDTIGKAFINYLAQNNLVATDIVDYLPEDLVEILIERMVGEDDNDGAWQWQHFGGALVRSGREGAAAKQWWWAQAEEAASGHEWRRL
ncbi:uncharacterized protein LOC131876770 [Cryptomeria japonica]|uniref:uncharacterized protein LOC131876770 n=1 Tax=Cryptomeria japonica TaxID=3369 RepID=UPI0027DA0050|nr:uncharacterized protein LOC131876770 [Cryptomeria japonica]